ncbi:TonB-dependent receptor [Catenovulum sp. SX2]|uniref:TonB-dependent receptor n=1 Tax=Catenovulum sp. SX2 TaxID=3398614 RepID=UPI003F85D47A
MKQFKPSLLTLALATTGLVSGYSYAAEEGADTEVEEVIQVRGFRASLIKAQSLKQDNSSIVEAITAEDIGKLPDSSIAESLARLPGLAAQRLDGRASSISIRGLGEDFSATTLNGREQVSLNDNRGVEFDVYPSEIMSGVVVYKTPDSTLMTQGAGGTIDMQTVKPLAHGDRSLSFSLRGEVNDIGALNPDGEDTGWRGSASYIDQFADDTIGVALAVAHMSSPNNEERWNSWGYPGSFIDANTNEVTSEAMIDPDGVPDSGDEISNHPVLGFGGAKPFVRSSNLTRDTLMGVLEFKPNDNIHIVLDALYIDFEDEKILRGIEIPGQWGVWDGGFASGIDYTKWEGDFLTEGTVEGVRGVLRNDYELRKAELFAAGANIKVAVSDSWTVEADLAISQTDRQVWSMESYAGSGRGNSRGVSDNIKFEVLPGAEGIKFTPELDYSDEAIFKMGGALSWGDGNPLVDGGDDQDGFINRPEIEDDLTTLKLTATKTFDSGIFRKLDVGVYYSDREKSKVDVGDFLTLKGFATADGTVLDEDFMLSIPDEYKLAPVSLDFIGMGDMVAYDSFRFYQDGNYLATPENLTTTGRWNNTWSVSEKVTTAFAKLDLDTEVGSTVVTGNVGVQVVRTEQSSSGYNSWVEGGLVEKQAISDTYSYTEVLPSLNLSAEVADSQYVRFGLARTMSRSRMDRMAISGGATFDSVKNIPGATLATSPWGGKFGNTALRPLMADQLDLTYENYFADEGYFATAFFYKDLSGWQQEMPRYYDFSGLEAPEGQVPETNEGYITSWENVGDGSVRGLEFTVSLGGSLISDALEGFGTILSATYLDSEVSFSYDVPGTADENGKLQTVDVSYDVQGLSDRVYNATVYYENNGFEVRVSMRKRSDFLGEVNAISFTRTPVNVKGSEIIDAQISYDFSEAGIDGLVVSLQGQNLNNEAFVTEFNRGVGDVRDYQNYGRNFLLGLNYSF